MVRPLQEPGTQVQGAGREGEGQNQDVLDYQWLFQTVVVVVVGL